MRTKLQKEILEVDWKNTEDVISFYEKNLIYFKNCDINSDLVVIEEVVDIKIIYAQSLDIKKHYTKAYECLKEVSILLGSLTESKFYSTYNEKYMFISGVVARRLNKIEESQGYFSQLVKLDSANDLYNQWYEHNKEAIVNNRLKYLGYFGLCLFFINMLINEFEYYSHQNYFRIEIFSIFLCFVGQFGAKVLKYFKKVL